ncbi:PadR family transcriptional regulator [Halobellus inordinatus]|uniref:PadR family transcriptional regulator n=1 Tax=Halobellus inordinatus TaxID=1126236 RepID=UPI00210EE9EA|nr:PadR family transcriptional regulator [Halobellus inordinatus]
MPDVLLPLALAYVDGNDEIEGATRFQKLAFLSQEETNIDQLHKFQADKYGPFSPSLAAAIDSLENKGLIKKRVEKTRSGKQKYNYRITDAGRRVIKSLQQDDDKKEKVEDILSATQEIKRKNKDMPLDRLLRYVYKKYPSYTTKSELDIADEVR